MSEQIVTSGQHGTPAAPSTEELYETSFQIIAAAGSAKSSYVEALNAAKQGRPEDAQRLLAEGDEAASLGHAAHTDLIQREAAGDPVQMNFILTHAEDQLLAAELVKFLVLELIEVYGRNA